MKTTVCKLPKFDSTSFFITHTIWDDEEIRINIFDNDTVWAGQFSNEDALKVSKTLGLSSEEYWTETRLALSTNHGADKFQYFVTDNHFKWVKLVVKDVEEKLEYGSVALETGVLSLSMERMIDHLIDTNNHLTGQVKNVNEEKSIVESDKQQLVETLHRHRSEKQAMEESLYANFLEILNAKKSKLAALQDREPKEEVRAISPQAGSSRARTSSPQAGSSRAKPSTWRRISRPTPVKRARKTIVETDSPTEQEFPFQQTRTPTTRETNRKASPEKPIPVEEPTAAVSDDYDGDTEIDEPPDDAPGINEEAKGSSVQFASNVKDKTLAEECPVELRRVDDANQMEAGCSEQSSKQPLEMSRSELREFNTQKLLDDLGI